MVEVGRIDAQYNNHNTTDGECIYRFAQAVAVVRRTAKCGGFF